MRPIALATTLFALSLTTLPLTASAQDGQPHPDYNLAYVLATASYCAYAVGQTDADRGEKRAMDCLTTAARLEGSTGLAEFQNIREADVEAFYNPKRPQDAYLLIQTPNRVILAFRGTLTPPILPSSGRFVPAVTEAIARANEKELLRTFIDDWINNVNPGAISATDRHPGFEASWSGLLDHLIAKPCTEGCSKFLSFVSPLNNGAAQRLNITGHSKGGALAVLAALDLPRRLGGDIVPVVYTFAGAKALTAAAAAAVQSDPAVKNMWRFEHAGDLVPSLPVDSSVTQLVSPLPLTAYAHVGNRAFFTKGKTVQPSPAPVDPDDGERLNAAAKNLSLPDNLLALIASLPTLGENKCEALVHNHFLILSDVQELARAGDGGPRNPITEGNLQQSFFFTGLPDSGGDILWGYSQWCRLLTAASK